MRGNTFAEALTPSSSDCDYLEKKLGLVVMGIATRYIIELLQIEVWEPRRGEIGKWIFVKLKFGSKEESDIQSSKILF